MVLALAEDHAGLLGWLGRRAGEVAARLAPKAAESAAATLSPAELEDLVAFSEVLVAGGSLLPAERSYLIDHLRQRARPGDYSLDLYRTTVEVLRRLAGARFSTLGVAERIALVTRYQLASSTVLEGETPGSFPAETLAIRTRAVPDLIGGYYRSPAGWAVVGYDAFPGKCGDLARYTGPEA